MKYRVYGIATASKYLGTVEANDADEAKEKAFNLDSCSMSLCHQCSSIDIGDVYEIDVEED